MLDKAPQETRPRAPGRRLLDADTGKEVELIYVLPMECMNPGQSSQPEPGLTDLIQKVWPKRWRVLISSMIFSGAVAGITFLFPDTYSYSTVIEIGRGTGEPVDAPEDVQEKLVNAFIPAHSAKLLAGGMISVHDLKKWEPKVEVPKGSTLVIVSSEGPINRAEWHLQQLHQLVAQVQTDHQRQMEQERNALRMKISAAERALLALDDEDEQLAKRRQTLEAERQLYIKREAELVETTNQAREDRRRALAELSGQAQTLTLMMIDRGMQADNQELVSIRQRISVGLANDLAALDRQVEDLQRRRDAETQNREDVSLKLRNIRDTRAVVAPTQSIEKTGPSRWLIVGVFSSLTLMATCVFYVCASRIPATKHS